MTTPAKKKPLRCRLHLHTWDMRVNDGGHRYYVCRHCHKYNLNITANANSPGGLGGGF